LKKVEVTNVMMRTLFPNLVKIISISRMIILVSIASVLRIKTS